jgi:copper transport protein
VIRSSGTRLLASVLALLTLLVAPALPGATDSRVLAHAQLVASSPGAGGIVPASPDEIRLIFSEPLENQLTSIDVVDLNGAPVLTRVGEVDPADRYALVVAQPGLPDGVYLLTWRTLSAADGHTAEGFFNFGVGDVPGSLAGGPQGMTHTDTDAPGVVGRWLTYLGLLLALGAAVFHRAVVRDGHLPRVTVRALAALLFVSAAATAAVAVLAGGEAGSPIDYLFGTRNGGLQAARAFVAAMGGVGLLLAPAGFAGIVAASTGLVGIVLLVAAGHAAALPGVAALAGQVVHVTGAAIWIGGVVGVLALVRWPGLVTATGTRPEMRTLVPRFSALALVSIGLVALTGVHAAWTQTGTLIPIGTEYGRTLLMKSAFAIGALALGGLNYLDGGRMMSWLDGFRSRVTIEAMLIVTVLVLTAALAITPPVEEAAGIAIEPIPDAFGEVTPGMSMDVSPGRPGINRVVVTTIDAMAGVSALELALDNLEEGTSTRVPLELEGMTGMDHVGGGVGMSHDTEDGTIDWTADALVLPAGSQWDTSVLVLAEDGTELSRQRFAFTLDDDGVDNGRASSLLDPALGIAAMLMVGGALGLGLGLGGMRLPRCEAVASRLALLAGGSVAVLLGGLIGAGRLLA